MITREEIEAELTARFGLASTNQTLGLHYFKLRQVFKEGVEWALRKVSNAVLCDTTKPLYSPDTKPEGETK